MACPRSCTRSRSLGAPRCPGMRATEGQLHPYTSPVHPPHPPPGASDEHEALRKACRLQSPPAPSACRAARRAARAARRGWLRRHRRSRHPRRSRQKGTTRLACQGRPLGEALGGAMGEAYHARTARRRFHREWRGCRYRSGSQGNGRGAAHPGGAIGTARAARARGGCRLHPRGRRAERLREPRQGDGRTAAGSGV